jgi:hypothetical protein
MTAYTSNTPNSGDIIANTQPLILANFQYLQTSGSVDHNFTANTSTSQDGYHKVVHFVNQGADPSAIAGTGQLYTKTISGDQVLFYESGGGLVSQLTAKNFGGTLGANPNGWTYFPGGLVLNYGRVTGFSGSWPSSGTVNFSSPNVTFGTAPFNVLTSFLGPTSSSSGDITITATTTSNFTWAFTGSSSASFNGFYWWALGK